MSDVDLDRTWICLRAVRRVNIQLFVFGIVYGLLAGIAVGFLVWGL